MEGQELSDEVGEVWCGHRWREGVWGEGLVMLWGVPECPPSHVMKSKVDGEGMYIGHYAADGLLRECNGQGNGAERLFPHLLENVQVYSNKLYDIGADGIQLAEVTSSRI